MIGVKVPEPSHRSALGDEDASGEPSTSFSGTGSAAGGGGRGGGGMDGFGAGMQAVMRPKLQPERMYLVDSVAGGRQGVQMPQPARSSFARALEFVLGY